MNSIIERNIKNIQEYCKKYEVKKLYVFGSVCTDNFTSDSDLDFLISFKDISTKEYTDNYFTLHYLFQEIFKRNVDLITENSLSNPYFIEILNKTKTLIYED